MSKRANNSFSNLTNSCALQDEDSCVKPTMSANRILQQKYSKRLILETIYIKLCPHLLKRCNKLTWHSHAGTCTLCWTAASLSDWLLSSCPEASHLQCAWARWTAGDAPVWGRTTTDYKNITVLCICHCKCTSADWIDIFTQVLHINHCMFVY